MDTKTPMDREEELSIRLSIAAAWVRFWQYAYDTLLHHGINWRNIPEYEDSTGLLDKAMDEPDIKKGQVHVIEYIKRLTSGLTAAVRRKGFKQV